MLEFWTWGSLIFKRIHRLKLKTEEDFSFGYLKLFCEDIYFIKALRLAATLFFFKVLWFKIQPTGGRKSQISHNSLASVEEPQGPGSHPYLSHFLVMTSMLRDQGKNFSEQQPIHSNSFFLVLYAWFFLVPISATPDVKLLFHLQENFPTFKNS